jgi:hypothetical protein
MEEDFEIVKRKGHHRSSPIPDEPATDKTETKPEYMILSEDEMQSQGNRMNWRKGANQSVADLFRIQHTRPEFPKIFQNYRPAPTKETPFTGMKLRTPKSPTGTVEPSKASLQINMPNEYDSDPEYADKTP